MLICYPETLITKITIQEMTSHFIEAREHHPVRQIAYRYHFACALGL